MITTTLQESILHRIETEVAPNCMHRLQNGQCLTPHGMPCPIVTNLSKIIEVVRTCTSDRIGPYVERLRESVCRECDMEDEFGECRLRNDVDCCLDALFVIVVNIIEEELESYRRPC